MDSDSRLETNQARIGWTEANDAPDARATLRETEARLQESEERLRLALDASEMGSFIWYVDEDRTDSDARMLALFDLPPDQPLTLAGKILPDDGDRYMTAVARACDPAGPGLLREEIRVRRPDGTIRWLSIAGQVHFEGRPRRAIRMAGTAVDITSRKRQEQELRESWARLVHVFELSPSFLAVLRGPNHVYDLANPALLQVLGGRKVLGLPVREAVPELADQGFLELLDRVYTTGEPFVANETLVRLQSASDAPVQERFLNFVYQPLREAGSTVTGILVSGMDVTELVQARRAAERLLAETEHAALERDAERQQLLTVLEQAPLAIAITGPSGEIRYRNSTFDRLWGRPAHDTRAMEYSEVYAGYHMDGTPIASHEWPGARAVLHGEVIEGEVIEIVHASGRRITVWINSAPVRDAEGRISGAVVMFRDITAERRTEQQLQDAQRLHAVGTLAGGVAHEVNNALQGALGFGSYVLRALGPDHPQAPDMRRVLQSAERAARVSQQLLAYTRQQVSQPRLVDLPAITMELRPVLQQLLGPDKLLQIRAPQRPVPSIHADPAQLEHVLINLIANARDATDTGGQVTIEVDHVDAATADTSGMGFALPPGVYVRLSVQDNGSGMEPQTVGRIFDPFFTTKAVGEGTGLGLSMVYGIVKQHGGYIGARSTPGKGTTMQLFWPVTRQQLLTDIRSGSSGAEAAHALGRGQTVLVAEDEPLLRALIARTLEEEGYRVLAAGDGEAAMALVEADGARPDLVLTDVIMPRMNGRQLHNAVNARWPSVPVLFISGHTGEGAVLHRLIPPGAPFVQKPFTPDALAQVVAVVLASGAQKR